MHSYSSAKSETEIYANNQQYVRMNETPPKTRSNSEHRFRNLLQIAALMHLHEPRVS